MKRLAVASLIIAGVGFAVLAVAEAGSPPPYGASADGPYGSPAPSQPPDCHSIDPPCPPSAPAEAAVSTFGFAGQLVMVPPQADDAPALMAGVAEDFAWAQDGGGAGAAVQTPVLAVLPAGGNFPSDVLVWVIKYTDIDCVMGSAPVGMSPSCNHTWTTVIDANTGEFIYGYTDA